MTGDGYVYGVPKTDIQLGFQGIRSNPAAEGPITSTNLTLGQERLRALMNGAQRSDESLDPERPGTVLSGGLSLPGSSPKQIGLCAACAQAQ